MLMTERQRQQSIGSRHPGWRANSHCAMDGLLISSLQVWQMKLNPPTTPRRPNFGELSQGVLRHARELTWMSWMSDLQHGIGGSRCLPRGELVQSMLARVRPY
ncbi:hypothetical protein OI25_5657 [Paraburkholderia fungorum]|uniref:Uncharacterized protein n=1 Tax=Paraburkholderia fungorum TaxID=134537 RepID=A0AAU8TQ29_9BURK|nr:hypothetical protein OI25_5657 [Paraburkholderia fungorum]PRZ48587.1 hypothetical protein BX589_12749 [Paraburkholderia fungorum]